MKKTALGMILSKTNSSMQAFGPVDRADQSWVVKRFMALLDFRVGAFLPALLIVPSRSSRFNPRLAAKRWGNLHHLSKLSDLA